MANVASDDVVGTPPHYQNNKPVEEVVRFDISPLSSIGRVKAPPVCLDETLKKEAMTAEELSKYQFPLKTPPVSIREVHIPEHVGIVSSSSSTASRESGNFSDFESTKAVVPPRIEWAQSERINSKVLSRTKSRQGRTSQRWITDTNSNKQIRLVTGCVPILEGGRILLCSASRKKEWILPKGGWELDEEMEESAIRECFEEAGVFGVLGPLLSEIEYETRKAKKRRLEFEELQKKAKHMKQHDQSSIEKVSGGSSVVADSDTECNNASVSVDITAVKSKKSEGKSSGSSFISEEENTRIRSSISATPVHIDETSSIASDASNTYSHVRMRLFPLYVTEVKASWPESGRFRKAVDIDEAIKLMESRPEFKSCLVELKERNLHLGPQEQS